jgi:hypothetical protein
MSRTDKTQPYRIRLWDGTLRRVAVHNHSDGVCDLPRTLGEDLAVHAVPGPDGASCHWALHDTGTKVCCCSLCHDSAGLKARRRAARHDARRQSADLMRLARTDWRDID